MKFQRQAKILEIIQKHDIDTQEELSEQLLARGIEATQATISRDIKDLRLVKKLSACGNYRYVASSDETNEVRSPRLKKIFRECVTAIDFAGNIVVIKTLPGLAGAAAAAVDSLKISDMVGSLAGDDTVFLAMRSEASAKRFEEEAENYLR